MVDSNFRNEYKRLRLLVADGIITKELASLLLETYAKAMFDAGSKIDYLPYCYQINPNHNENMLQYRMARPASLAL